MPVQLQGSDTAFHYLAHPGAGVVELLLVIRKIAAHVGHDHLGMQASVGWVAQNDVARRQVVQELA